MSQPLSRAPGVAVDLRCPRCTRGALAASSGADTELRCAGCGAAYPVLDGIIDLLPPTSTRRTVAQWTMEAEPIVRIYESRLWRRGPLLTAALGIAFDRELEVVLGAAGLQGAETVLDLACGPGIYTRPFARRVPRGRVFGLDMSGPMLRHAARRVREEQLENVTLIRGTALDLPFPPEHCDVVNCCGALHLFPDVGRALGEIARVLRPGGRFTVAAFGRREGTLDEIAARVRRRLIGMDSFTPAALETHLREAGLGDVERLHTSRAWLVVSARKPDREG